MKENKSFFKRWFRTRSVGLVFGSAAVLVYIYLSSGTEVLPAFVGELAMPIIAVWFAFIMRKILLDYVDVEELYNKLKETSVGSGIGFLGVCIVMFALLGLFGGQVRAQPVATYIPEQAHVHIPTLRKEQATYWPDSPFPGSSLV